MADNTKSRNRKILVGNLPIGVSEEELVKLFSQSQGTVVSISLTFDSRGRNSGHAFVEMSTREEALAIIETGGFELNGRALNMSIAEQPEDESRQPGRRWFQFGPK